MIAMPTIERNSIVDTPHSFKNGVLIIESQQRALTVQRRVKGRHDTNLSGSAISEP